MRPEKKVELPGPDDFISVGIPAEWAEYVIKTKDALVESGTLFQDKLFKGNALLVNMGYSKSGLGYRAAVIWCVCRKIRRP